MSQSNTTAPDVIMLVGTDERLVYLLQRYFESCHCKLVPWLAVPSVEEISQNMPVVLIFSTSELLESAQTLLDYTSAHEIPVLVCTSVAGEARARELGADACLLHPLTYDSFKSTLEGIYPVEV